ncbi:MAG: hypothetical protein OZ934_03500 [Anaerolineae bacterium]|nr:hypothetical protein [Anaerolineae bacterium]
MSLLRRRRRYQQPDEIPSAQMADAFDADSAAPGDEEMPIEPFVSVSGADAAADRAYAYSPAGMPAAEEETPARRRSSRPAAGARLRFWVLLLALALIAGGIFGTLLRQDRLREEAVAWWPAILLVASALWMLIALVRRQVTSFLGGAALAGVGLSALLDAQDIAALRETLLGIVLVAVGLGIVVRGFLLRGRTVR